MLDQTEKLRGDPFDLGPESPPFAVPVNDPNAGRADSSCPPAPDRVPLLCCLLSSNQPRTALVPKVMLSLRASALAAALLAAAVKSQPLPPFSRIAPSYAPLLCTTVNIDGSFSPGKAASPCSRFRGEYEH